MSEEKNIQVPTASSECKECDKQYRGNLAGFIVQGLFAIIFLAVGIVTAFYMFSTGGVYEKEKTNSFYNFVYGTLHSYWGEKGRERAANVYFLCSIATSFASVGYLGAGMMIKSLFWHRLNYLFNLTFWSSLAMMAYSWYFTPDATNGIAWVWTVMLFLSLGLELILVLVTFVDPKHAYVLPWIKAEAVPKMVI